MAYELIIYQAEGTPQTTKAQTIVDAFENAGLPCVEQPDDFGHWLILEGFESALDLTIRDSIVTGAGFRYTSEDDEAIIQKVAVVFKSIGWLVSDDEGMTL